MMRPPGRAAQAATKTFSIVCVGDDLVDSGLDRLGKNQVWAGQEAFRKFMADEFVRRNKVREAAGIPQQ
jgi:hypothetical protein